MLGLPQPVLGGKAPLAFRDAYTFNSPVATPGVLGPVPGQKAGDVLLLLATCQSGATLTTPSGFSLLRSSAPGNYTFYVYSRTADADDITFTPSWSGNGNKSYILAAWSGATGTVSASNSVATTTSADISANSTPTSSFGNIVAFVGIDVQTAAITAHPPDMIQRATHPTPTVYMFEEPNVPAGSSGTRAFTWNNATFTKAALLVKVI